MTKHKAAGTEETAFPSLQRVETQLKAYLLLGSKRDATLKSVAFLHLLLTWGVCKQA